MDGTLDIYIYSAFPTLAVQELSGSQIIARRWKNGVENYWSTYFFLQNSGIESVEDFKGKVLAFEHPESTSVFVLPAGTLIEQGYTLREVDRPDAAVASDQIGYYFSQDEENTTLLVMEGLVAGGGFSNLDYEGLSEELRSQISFLGETISVPRQLVSIRPGVDPRLAGRIKELLFGLDQTEEGRAILEHLKETKKFDELPAKSVENLQSVRDLMRLVSQRP